MLSFFAHLIVTAALLLIAARLVRGFNVEGWKPALIGAVVLGFVNAVIRPIMVFLTFPITILTFGLFLLVVNALMLWLVASVVPGMRIQSFWTALVGSLVITLLNVVIEMFI
jgi:putative membrane protein